MSGISEINAALKNGSGRDFEQLLFRAIILYCLFGEKTGVAV